MKRRTMLATGVSVLAGLAGCIDGTDAGDGPGSAAGASDTDSTDSPTPSPAEGEPVDGDGDGDTETTSAGADVTVENVVLQHGYVVPSSPDSIGVRDGANQYLVASVTVDGSLPREAFGLAVGDETVSSPTTLDEFYRTRWGDEEWYERDRTSGLLLFRPMIESGDEEVRLTWPGGEHAVGGSIPDRLSRSTPVFSAAFDLPDTVAGETAPSVDIEVTNEGDSERRFLGALNRSGPLTAYAPLARVSELVGAGETVTITYDDSWFVPSGGFDEERIGDGQADLRYHLHYPGGPDQTHDIELVKPD